MTSGADADFLRQAYTYICGLEVLQGRTLRPRDLLLMPVTLLRTLSTPISVSTFPTIR